MATKYLAPTAQSNASKGIPVYFTSDRREALGNGAEIMAPAQAGELGTWMVTLIPTSGSGKIQATISEAEPRHWFDWDAGVVSVPTSDVLFGVKAVRVVNVSGTVGVEVRAY